MVVDKDEKVKHALRYLDKGYAVVRLHGQANGICTCGKMDCKSIGKHPNTEHGTKDATQDPDIVRRWWNEAPWSNVGIAPHEGIVAIDVDPKNGGDETWAKWQAEFGAIDRTPQSRTGSGGYHYLLSLPPGIKVKNTANKVGAGVDLRTLGGLIVVEPSVTDKGSYEWIVPSSEPIAPCPDWLLDKIRESKGFHADPATKPQASTSIPTSWTWSDRPIDFPSHPGAEAGERHPELCRLIGIHLDRGDSVRTVEAMAIEWNARCQPPKPEAEVMKAVRGLGTKVRREPKAKGLESPPLATIGVSEQDDEAEADDETSLDAEAFIGLAGDIIRAIEPETETDPAGILITLLAAIGNAVGSKPHANVGPVRHHANLFTAIVGDTASRKGVSLSTVKWLMKEAAAEWHDADIGYGLSSGEGLIERVRDDGTGEVKRLFAVEPEFVRLLQVKGREGNTLNASIRNAWDGMPMESMTRSKGSEPKNKATNHHVSILGHITPKELAKAMSGSVDVSNGFVNRFLWCRVERRRFLPEGGDIQVLKPFVEPLRRAIVKAREIERCWRDDDAKRLQRFTPGWHTALNAGTSRVYLRS